MDELSLGCVVVGAGPAGLAAAVNAAESGLRVAVIDENDRTGGQIWRSNRGALHPNAVRWLERADRAGVRFIAEATVLGRNRSDEIEVVSGDRPFRIKTESVILATGGRELFLPFPGWTLPGVTGVGGLQALVKGGLDIRGKDIVIAGSGPLVPAVAAELKRRGATVNAVAEQADFVRILSFGLKLARHPRKMFQALQLGFTLRGVPKHFSCWPSRAEGTDRVERVVLSGKRGTVTIPCDFLASSFGLIADTRLARLLGCSVDDRGIVVDEDQMTDVPGVYAAGECTGIGGVDVALVEGSVAGLAVAGRVDDARRLFRRRSVEQRFAAALEGSFALRRDVLQAVEDSTVVCRCEDVRWADLKDRESWRSAKLLTRVGMGPCQGRVCGAALCRLKGWTDPTPRPPLQPVPLAALTSSGQLQPR